mmetsp:Transcript_11099/g.23495  ORF Transcript_11099/g.23495 Transcript_11099/m.23495 type:complete len:228 (+) Transcript_11099:598-1281(+)
MYTVRAVVMHPVQKRLKRRWGSVSHSLQGKEVDIVARDAWIPSRARPASKVPSGSRRWSNTPRVHKPYPIEDARIAISCAAVMRGASSGYSCMACSILQKPRPKAKGCTIDRASPVISSPLPPPNEAARRASTSPSSRKATPTSAMRAPTHWRGSNRFPVIQSRSGTMTTAMLQRKADLDASVVSSPTAWETYPREFHRPTSSPNMVAINRRLLSLAASLPLPLPKS